MEKEEFDIELVRAMSHIRSNEISAAEKVISRLLIENNHSPEVHNLLGAMAELSGDTELARTHYRISCTIDPSYSPASGNLKRVSLFHYKHGFEDIDFGEEC